MMNVLIIAVLLVLAMIVIKINPLRHKLFIIFVISLVLFLYLTLIMVNNRHDLDFRSTQGIIHSIKVYTGWLSNSFNNMLAITGHAGKMDWTNANTSVFNKSQKDKDMDDKSDLAKRFAGYRP